MSENHRLPDYLDHIQQAAADACSFVEGLAKEDFLADKRTQQAVIMSLIVIGEAVTKVMDGYAEFAQAHGKCRGAICAICAIASPTAISTSTSMWCGTPYSTTGVAQATARRASGC
jgi:hypothetical protein